MIAIKKRVSQVAVVSSCSIVRIALAELLCEESLTMTWSSASSGEEVLKLLRNAPVDMLILMLHVHADSLPEEMDLLRTLRYAWPQMRLVVVPDKDIHYVEMLLHMQGVKEIFSMQQPLSEWRTGLRYACEIEDLPEVHPVRFVIDYNWLSPTEALVIRHLIEGQSLPEIAVTLMRNVKTISCHKSSAMKKLGLTHYSELVAVKSLLSSGLGFHKEPLLMPTASSKIRTAIYERKFHQQVFKARLNGDVLRPS